MTPASDAQGPRVRQPVWQQVGNLAFDCDCAITTPLEPHHHAAPSLYALELTPLCPHRCAGCSNVFRSTGQDRTTPHHPPPFTVEQWEAVLERIAPFAQRLKVTGGEPTCHPHFESIVRAIRQHHIPFTLFTNGSWSHPDRVLDVLRHTPECLGLLVSLHGADALAHEAFTGVQGSFAETVQNIRRAVAAGVPVYTSTVLHRGNLAQVEAVVTFSQSLGAARAVFNRYIGVAVPALDVPVAALVQATERLQQLATQGYPIHYGTPMPDSPEESACSSFTCAAGSALCTIDPWGYVRPCNHAPLIIGHILTDAPERLWQATPLASWHAVVPEHGCRADRVLKP